MKISRVEYSRYCQRCGEYALILRNGLRRGWDTRLVRIVRKRVKVDGFEYRRIQRDKVQRCRRKNILRALVCNVRWCRGGRERENERKEGEERERSKHEYSTTGSLFAILCIRDAHFYAFTFTGWKATSYSVEAGDEGGKDDGGDRVGTEGGKRRLNVSLTCAFRSFVFLLLPSYPHITAKQSMTGASMIRFSLLSVQSIDTYLWERV